MKVGDLVEHKQPWKEGLGVVVAIDSSFGSYCKVQWSHGETQWIKTYYLWEVTDESR